MKDYDWFDNHTMYLNVEYKTDIKQLVRKITYRTERIIKHDTKFPPRFILEPHLTICKDLNNDQYEKSRIEYQQKTFSGDFIADSMILLKRSVVMKAKYEEVGNFEFLKPEIYTKTVQGKLF